MMAGTVTIKDGNTKRFVFQTVRLLRHNYDTIIDRIDSPGSETPAIDHIKTVYHTIQIDFEIVDRGAYNPGVDPGTTGSIWKQQKFLQAFKSQSVIQNYYTIIEDDDTENTGGYNGVIFKVMIDRTDDSQIKKSGTILFLESEDIFEY